MNTLKKHLPVLFSARFWGIIVTVVAMYLNDSSLISSDLFNYIAMVTGSATAIGTADKVATKIGSSKE